MLQKCLPDAGSVNETEVFSVGCPSTFADLLKILPLTAQQQCYLSDSAS